MSKSLGTLEKLEVLIPGFRGYKIKELIREDDRLVRQYVTSKIYESLNILEGVQAQVLSSSGLKAADELELIVRKLRMTADKIKYAPSGYAGLFDRAKVWESTLNKLLDIDGKLVPIVNSISEKVQALKNVSLNPDPQVIHDTITSVSNLCDEVSKLVQQREMLIIGEDR